MKKLNYVIGYFSTAFNTPCMYSRFNVTGTVEFFFDCDVFFLRVTIVMLRQANY